MNATVYLDPQLEPINEPSVTIEIQRQWRGKGITVEAVAFRFHPRLAGRDPLLVLNGGADAHA